MLAVCFLSVLLGTVKDFPIPYQIGSALRRISQKDPKVEWTGDEQGFPF